MTDEPTKTSISSILECRTYRIKEVPLKCGKNDLEQLLNQGTDVKLFKVKSLAMEHHGRYQTATADALDGAGLPADIDIPPEISWACDVEEIPLQADDKFNGLTTLFAPPEEEHKVDVVAICGLGGHAIGSFRHKKTHHIWLRDSLPRHLTEEHSDRPMARLMTYGYDSRVARSEDTRDMEGYALGLRETLGGWAGKRPLVFIAHSLGGLIIKETIISLHQSAKAEHKMLLQKIYGVLFFAVPHAGMKIESLVSMCGGGYNLGLMVSLSNVSSTVLSKQRREFNEALGKEKNAEVFCFYESRPSPTAIEVAKDEWKMEGPKEILLTQTSATHCRQWEEGSEHVCPISASHSDIVKFRRNEAEYEKVLQKVKGVCHRALGTRNVAPSPGVQFIVPYPLNPNFVGRGRILRRIKDTLELHKRPEARKVRKLALYGLGGIGKSQIAIAFAYWVRDEYRHNSVLWVHASSDDRFRRAYENIAEAYDIPGHNDPKTDILVLVRDFLNRSERKEWLMIIDNADDNELFFSSGADDTGMPSERGLCQYIPRCTHGTILMTTRTKKAGLNLVSAQDSLLIEIRALAPEEAHRLIQHTLGSEEVATEQASSLSQSLENLPLALVQALAYIKMNSMTIGEYQTLREGGDTALIDQLCEHFPSDQRDEDMPNAVAAAWFISFEQIMRTDPLAAKIMSVMSLLDQQAIPDDLVVTYQTQRGGSEASDRRQYEDRRRRITSLGTLIAYSFITKSTEETYDMHRLVHLVTRRWLVKKQRFDDFASRATSVILAACPRPGWKNLDVFAKVLPHARAVASHRVKAERTVMERAVILHRTGWYLGRTSQFVDAEQCAVESQRIREEYLGPSHRQALWAVYLRLWIYGEQGNFPAATELAKGALERGRDSDADADVILAITRILAWIHRRQGELPEAEEILLSCLETAKAKLGDHHDQPLYCLRDLANVYIKQGRLDEAQVQLEVVIATRGRLQGNEHPHALAAMHDLARIYSHRRCFRDAANLNKRTWQSRQRHFGDDNAVVLSSQQNYACNLEDLGQHQEAIELMRDCQLRTSRLLGPAHADTLSSQRLLREWESRVHSHT